MRHDLSWLHGSFAHRGLHEAARGIVENTLSAFAAAADAGYGIELDLRLSACGTPMVFHDRDLSRLAGRSGLFSELDREALQSLELRHSSDRVPTLRQVLDLIAGRVPLLLEVKSDNLRAHQPPTAQEDRRVVVNSILDVLTGYDGHLALMSFDPDFVSLFRQAAPHLPRGLVAARFSAGDDWHDLGLLQRWSRRNLLSCPLNRPHFIGYALSALPAPAPLLARRLFGLPLLGWTARKPEHELAAKQYCDGLIFEGFQPRYFNKPVVAPISAP